MERALLSLKPKPHIFQRDPTVFADNNMVEKFDAHYLTGLVNGASHCNIFRGGRRIAGGVIVLLLFNHPTRDGVNARTSFLE